jgi:hypothetical protein
MVKKYKLATLKDFQKKFNQLLFGYNDSYLLVRDMPRYSHIFFHLERKEPVEFTEQETREIYSLLTVFRKMHSIDYSRNYFFGSTCLELCIRKEHRHSFCRQLGKIFGLDLREKNVKNEYTYCDL